MHYNWLTNLIRFALRFDKLRQVKTCLRQIVYKCHINAQSKKAKVKVVYHFAIDTVLIILS